MEVMRVMWVGVLLFVWLGGCTTVNYPAKHTLARLDALEGKLDQAISDLKALRNRVEEEDEDEEDEPFFLGPRSRRGPRKPSFDYATSVKKIGDYKYQISRKMLDEQLTDPTALGMQARIIPNYRKGKYEGFKLVGVKPGSLYRAVGIRSGDIIRAVNGRAINSPNKAMELFVQLKNTSRVKVEIERRGELYNFEFIIK